MIDLQPIRDRGNRVLGRALEPRRLAYLAIAGGSLGAAGCSSDGVSPSAQPVELAVPAASGSGQAHLAAGPGGELVLSWLEPIEDGNGLKFSMLENGEWGEPRTVVSGDDFFVNWADFPSVVPITSEIWVAHWLKRAPDSFASYDIAFAISADGGRSFEGGELLNADGVLTEHGFVSLFPWDGRIGAIWLDGRRIAEQFESGEFDPEGPPVGISLRFARIGYDGAVEARGEIDELVCDCCQTGAALAGDDPVVVYRDRSPDELRDIAVRRYTAGEWSAPTMLGPDGWRIEGCPVNGPAVAASGEQVVAAWFTAPDSAPRVRLARSSDGGASFSAPVEVDGAGAFGHVDVVLLGDGDAVVSWWRRDSIAGEIELAVRRIGADGRLGDVRSIATNAIAQPLDVPQMALAGDRLVLAWTDVGESRVRSEEVPLP